MDTISTFANIFALFNIQLILRHLLMYNFSSLSNSNFKFEFLFYNKFPLNMIFYTPLKDIFIPKVQPHGIINIMCVQINEANMKKLVEWDQAQRVKSIEISRSIFLENSIALLASNRWQKLQRLQICNCVVSNHQEMKFLFQRQWMNLQKFSFYGCYINAPLINSIDPDRFPKLRFLHLRDCLIDDLALKFLSSLGLILLDKIVLQKNLITWKGIKNLIRNPYPMLERISLNENPFVKTSGLIAILCNNFELLEINGLKMSQCMIGNSKNNEPSQSIIKWKSCIKNNDKKILVKEGFRKNILNKKERLLLQ